MVGTEMRALLESRVARSHDARMVVPEEECATEGIDYLDERLGETGSGEPIGDDER